jgi:hypothetical protein
MLGRLPQQLAGPAPPLRVALAGMQPDQRLSPAPGLAEVGLHQRQLLGQLEAITPQLVVLAGIAHAGEWCGQSAGLIKTPAPLGLVQGT